MTACVLIAGACSDGRTSVAAGTTASDNQVRAVYAHAQRSLTTDGVYRATERVTSSGAGLAETEHDTVRVWVDATHGQARIETSDASDPAAGGAQIEVITNGTRSGTVAAPIRAPGCEGASAVTAVVLGCSRTKPWRIIEDTVAVARGRHNGQVALVLTRHNKVESDDDAFDIRTTTYLDPSTGLPFTSDARSIIETEANEKTRTTTSNRSTFVARSSLPKDFFAPQHEHTRAAPTTLPPLHTHATVYWLGSSYDPGGGLPALTWTGEADQLCLTDCTEEFDYYDTSDTTGANLAISVFAPADHPTPCTGTPVKVRAGHATLCSDRASRNTLEVVLPGAVVLVNGTPKLSTDHGALPNPYSTVAALTAATESLRRR